MNGIVEPDTLPVPRMFVPAEPLTFSVPARHNPRLKMVAERINADEELRQWWRSANINAVDRLGLGDCGEVHVRIVANAALKLLRLLREAGHPPAAVAYHRLTPDEAEIIVVLAAAVHDLGLAVHTEPSVAARAGLVLADRKLRELLEGLYPVRERTVLAVEALQAMVAAQETNVASLSLEASAVKLADALDLTKGRARLSTEASRRPVAANMAPVVDEVTIQRFKTPPVRIVLRFSRANELPAVEALLRSRLKRVPLAGLVGMVAQLDDEGGRVLQPMHVWTMSDDRSQ